MKSGKGCFAAVVVAAVVLGIASLYLGRELTESKRDAAVAHIRELAKTNNIGPVHQVSDDSSGDAVLPSNAPNNADARALFRWLMEQQEALFHSPALGGNAYTRMVTATGSTDPDFAFLEQITTQADEILRETRRLSRMPGPYFDRDYSKGYASVYSPELRVLTRLHQLIGADAQVKLRKDNAGLVIEDLIALLRLAKEVPADPYIVTLRERNTLFEEAFRIAQEAVTARSATPEQLGQMLALAPPSGDRELFRQALIGEATMIAATWDDIRANGDPKISVRARWLYLGPLGAPWSNQDETYCMETFARLVVFAALPYYEAKPQLDAITREHPKPSRWPPILDHLCNDLGRVHPNFYFRLQADYEAKLNILRTGLCLQRYRQEHGVYPIAPAGSVNAVGGRPPLDPYSGNDYVYKPSDDSFALYSVGANGSDDNGTGDDIVWRGKGVK